MIEQFDDYYALLEITPDADDALIQASLAAARDIIDRERNYPDRKSWTDAMDERVRRATVALTDPNARHAYDALRARVLLENAYRGVLEIDPPYTFGRGDTDEADTVPALAHKLDGDWTRALKAILEVKIEKVLEYTGYNRNDKETYDALVGQIRDLRLQLGERHKRPLVESVIVLCDPEIERPVPLLNGQALDDSAVLPSWQIRPDMAATAQFRIGHGDSRGCLFGYLWLEDSWAEIVQPAPQEVAAGGANRKVAVIDLAGSETVNITLKFDPAQVMKLERPATHSLRLAALFQPNTSQEWRHNLNIPVAVTKIPAKGRFSPPEVVVSSARRGTAVSATSVLVNDGEEPLNATTSTTDRGVSVAMGDYANGGEVRVQVDTSDVRYGQGYAKTATFRADGDNGIVPLRIRGEVLPTPLQHMLRQQPLLDRLTLAGSAAVLALIAGPLALASLSSFLYWLMWLAVDVAAAVGATAWIAPRFLRHLAAAGNTTAEIAWRPLLLGVGGAAGAVALVVELLPIDVGTKILVLAGILAFAAAAWGVFINERWIIYRRTPSNASPANSNSTPR